MKHNIIKTDNYLLVVDESEIKEGDYRVNIQRGYVKLVDDAPEYYNQRNDVFKKVIAHLPLNGSPILEGVELLPPLEQEDDEKLVREHFELDKELNNPSSFKAGYNKAKENLHKILSDFYFYATDGEVCNHEIINEFIQSLSQPKMPIEFDCKMYWWDNEGSGNWVIDTTTNSQGHKVWLGTYIFN